MNRPEIRVTVGSVLLILLSALVTPTVADTIRVALPAMQRSTKPTPANTFSCATTAYLRERLAQCPSVRLVSEERNDAIIGLIKSPARSIPRNQWFAEFAKCQPIDVLIEYSLDDNNTVTVEIMTKDGIKTHQVPVELIRTRVRGSFRTFNNLSRIVHKTVAFIAENLPISASERKIITEKRIKDDGVFGAVYRIKRYPKPLYSRGRVSKSTAGFAEIRLRVLNEAWKQSHQSAELASLILDNAAILFKSDPEQKKEIYLVNPKLLASQAFPAALAKEHVETLQHLVVLNPDHYTKKLLALAEPVLNDLSSLEDALGDDSDALDSLTEQARVKSKLDTDITRDKRLVALQLLGILNQRDAIPTISKAIANEHADVRESGVKAASDLPFAHGESLLRKALRDTDKHIALIAAASLRKHGQSVPELLPLARISFDSSGGTNSLAQQVIALDGASEDIARLQKIATMNGPLQGRAVARLLKVSKPSQAQMLNWLEDPDASVVMAVLKHLAKTEVAADLAGKTRQLAGDPSPDIADAARVVVASTIPKDDLTARNELILETEHPLLRLRLLNQAATAPTPDIPLLEKACRNDDPHVRARAITLLAEKAPKKAIKPLGELVLDPHAWTRFHAAAAAAKIADSSLKGVLEKALASEKDAITKLYLADALARANGDELPARPKPAISIKGKKNLAWNTSPARYAPTSPFDAYYSMHTKANAYMKATHQAGKIIFARATPIGCPALILLDSEWRDKFWMNLDAELLPDNIRFLDGIIYGEETMKMHWFDDVWQAGWRLFCRDAGIDPEKINGDMTNLNTFERRAWAHWAIERNVDGFNLLYEFTKRRYGRVRPGIQVCTFMPAECLKHPSCPPAIKKWKFDAGGVYDYKGDNRIAGYSMIRRYQTLWPNREVIWLSLGIGGYEMNPVFHHQKVPKQPMLDRYNRAFSDSLTAWMAGADTGWFSTWLFMSTIKGSTNSMSRLRGVHIWVEDIGPESEVLDRAVSYVNNGLDKVEEKVVMPDLEKAGTEDEDLKDLLEDQDEKHAKQLKAVRAKLSENSQRLKIGFLFYQQYVYDCARIFSGLPRQRHHYPALAIQKDVNVWWRPPYKTRPLIPAMGILNQYDFLTDVNMVGVTPLASYNYIVIHAPETIDDATLATLNQWVKNTTGILVIHQSWPDLAEAEASTPSDHDGKLVNTWPWTDDVRVASTESPVRVKTDSVKAPDGKPPELDADVRVASTFAGKPGDYRSWLDIDGKSALGVWRRKGWKGAVVFEGVVAANHSYMVFLRDRINKLAKDLGNDWQAQPPALMEILTTPQIQAAASSRYYSQAKGLAQLQGVDVMNGDIDPKAGGTLGSKSSLVLKNYTSTHVACSASLAAVSQEPFIKAEIKGDSLVLKSGGVVRVASSTGKLTVATEDGKPLPEIDPKDVAKWMFYSKEDGICYRQWKNSNRITYFRSKTPVTVKPVD